jgi:hypothetical protein
VIITLRTNLFWVVMIFTTTLIFGDLCNSEVMTPKDPPSCNLDCQVIVPDYVAKEHGRVYYDFNWEIAEGELVSIFF